MGARVLQRSGYFRPAAALKIVFLAGVIGGSLYPSHSMRAVMIPDPKPELYGIWHAEDFTIVGGDGAPEPTVGEHWQRLIISGPAKFGFVQQLDGKRVGVVINIDSTAKKLTLKGNTFTYSTPSPNVPRLEGQYEGRDLSATLRLVDENSFLLRRRGFNWVSESPFNR